MSVDPPLESVRLNDDSVVLRAFTPADVEPLLAAVLASAAELRPWMPWFHAGYSIADTRGFVDAARKAGQRGDEYNFGVFSPAGDLWGGCGLNRRDRVNRSANLGYWIRSDQTGQGVATAAARLVAQFGFESLRLERLTILAAVANRASQEVARKLGAQYEGLARRAIRAADQQHDAACFSLISTDCRETP